MHTQVSAHLHTRTKHKLVPEGECHLRSFLWPLPMHAHTYIHAPTHTQNRNKGTLQSVVMCFGCYIEIRVKDFDLLAKVLAGS